MELALLQQRELEPTTPVSVAVVGSDVYHARAGTMVERSPPQDLNWG